MAGRKEGRGFSESTGESEPAVTCASSSLESRPISSRMLPVTSVDCASREERVRYSRRVPWSRK